MGIRRAAWLACAVALLVAGCTDDDGGARIIAGGERITATSTSTSTAAGTSTPPPSSPTAEATATPSPTATPEATSTATATPTAGSTAAADDLEGFPFSTADVRAAFAEAERIFTPIDVEPVCASTSVPEVTVWGATMAGTDYGPAYTLWVYPDGDALAEDWSTGEDGVEPRVPDCELPTGYVYWNANAILAFRGWWGLNGLSTYDELRDPRNEAPVGAFLGMTPPR